MSYLIGGKEYNTIKYPKLTYAEEKLINQFFVLQNNGTELSVTNTENLISLLLIDKEGKHPPNIDDLKYESILEIIAEYLAERDRFLSSMGEHLMTLVEQKKTPGEDIETGIN